MFVLFGEEENAEYEAVSAPNWDGLGVPLGRFCRHVPIGVNFIRLIPPRMASPIVVTKIDQDKLVVTQANKLAEASYTMSLEEKRVVLLMVSLVRKEDKDFQTYRIPIADIRDYLGLSTKKLYDDIKRVGGVEDYCRAEAAQQGQDWQALKTEAG